MLDLVSRPEPAGSTLLGPATLDRWYTSTRIIGLSRFAIAITFLTLIGHLFLGFEQSWITPFVALATTYTVDLVGETLDARAEGRAPRYRGSVDALIRFLLPAHISGLAIAMLLYAAEQLWAVVFAAAVAMASKWIVRVRRPAGPPGAPTHAHYLNPSNFGIAITLILFPGVGIAPPYQFAENLSGTLDWAIPAIIIITGSWLNLKATNRFPLILAWLGGFLLQAVVRGVINDTPIIAGLVPMTGFAFLLFTFYMVTDPATTPSTRRGQILFGAGTALAYAILMQYHVVFGLFFSLLIVSGLRTVWMVGSRLLTPLAAVPAPSR